MSSTAERRADAIRDFFLDRHESTTHLNQCAADEHANLGIALSLIDCALARIAHHQKGFCALAKLDDAAVSLIDARCTIETERAALGRVANIRSAAA